MNCHGNPAVPQAPQPSAIRQMSPERISSALTTGVMKVQGDQLSDNQKRMLAAFMSGRPLGSLASGEAKDMQGRFPFSPPLAAVSRTRDWNAWSPTTDNASDGAICFDRRPIGEDGSALPG